MSARWGIYWLPGSHICYDRLKAGIQFVYVRPLASVNIVHVIVPPAAFHVGSWMICG
jgi:hypothetical protein